MILSEKEFNQLKLSIWEYIVLKAVYEQDIWIIRDSTIQLTILEGNGYVRRVNDKYVATIKADHIFLTSAKVTEVIKYFSEVTGKRASTTSEANRKHIQGRLKNGYTVDDLKLVIDYQTHLCKIGKFDKTYLRLETLFNDTKFESYYGNAGEWNGNTTLSNTKMV